MDLSLLPPAGILPQRVIAIIPATGWRAVFALSSKAPKVFRKPLACFALVDRGDYNSVEGFTGAELFISAERSGNFLGYEAPGERADFTDEWQEWRLTEQERHAARRQFPELEAQPITFSRN